MNNLISTSEYNAEQVAMQSIHYSIDTHLRNDNDVHCGSQNLREGSNCPPSVSTQPRSLLRHCPIALSICQCQSHAGRVVLIPPQSAEAVHRHP